LHAEGTQDGEYHGREYGVDACKYADTDAAKRGMCNATADENQPAGDDVGAYKAAQNACQ
jgi:hypothetical protein